MSKLLFRIGMVLLAAAFGFVVPKSLSAAAGFALAGTVALLSAGVAFWVEAVSRVVADDPAKRPL